MDVTFSVKALATLSTSSDGRIPTKADGVSDFVTFACREKPHDSEGSAKIDDQMKDARKRSLDAVLHLTAPDPSAEEETIAWSGRVCICPCEGGKYWSLACRDLEQRRHDASLSRWTSRAKPLYSPPVGRDWLQNPDVLGGCLASYQLLTTLLYQELFGHRESIKTGLLLFTGETSSGKSKLIQGVIRTYLNSLGEVDKHGGHLVTLERPILKPIETRVDEPAPLNAVDEEPAPPEGFPVSSLRRGLEVTRRQQGEDFRSVKHGLEDALRQKPALVYIDEVRSPDEWEHILRFATTGHLVATTAHAANVPIALSKLVREMKAVTPAQRGEIGRALFGLVHIRSQKVSIDNEFINAKIPALWRRTEMGISSLISPGLDSLVPTMCAKRGGADETPHYLGRSYFATRIQDEYKATGKSFAEIISKAREWDLTEL